MWHGIRPSGKRAFTALGLPLGHLDYASANGGAECADAQRINMPDLQSAWLLLPLRGSTKGQPHSAKHPARRGAAVCRSARPLNLRDLVGMLGEEAGGSDPLVSPASHTPPRRASLQMTAVGSTLCVYEAAPLGGCTVEMHNQLRRWGPSYLFKMPWSSLGRPGRGHIF